MSFDDYEQGRLRTVLGAVVSDAPMAPDLEMLATSIQPLSSTHRLPRRMRGVAVMAGAAVAVLIAVAIPVLFGQTAPNSVGAGSTMQPGVGASPMVETLLEQSQDGFLSGTGLHVATYVGPGGPVDVYSFEKTIKTSVAVGGLPVPPRTLKGYCIGWGPSGTLLASDCGTVPRFPIETPWVSFDVADADGNGTGLILVPSDVAEVILEFKNETQISIKPAAGVAYAAWESGGFPRNVEIVRIDGTSEQVRT